MTPRRIRFTATAQRHVRDQKTWWLEHRTHQDVFATDLEHALRVVALLPGAGVSYNDAGIAGLRRIYVRKIDCHLYYTYDDRDVIIRALWGARRKHGPRLRSSSSS